MEEPIKDKVEQVAMVDKFINIFSSKLKKEITKEEKDRLLKEKFEKTLALFNLSEEEYIKFSIH